MSKYSQKARIYWPFRWRSIPRSPIGHPPGIGNLARRHLASKGPRTTIEARIFRPMWHGTLAVDSFSALVSMTFRFPSCRLLLVKQSFLETSTPKYSSKRIMFLVSVKFGTFSSLKVSARFHGDVVWFRMTQLFYFTATFSTLKFIHTFAS